MKFNKIITGMDRSKSFRVYMAITTELVQKAKEIHNTTPLATHALGRVLTGTSLMSRLLKNDSDKLTIQFKGDGPAAEILCTGYGTGDVKGYIANPDVDLPPVDGQPDVGGSLGIGNLTVIKDLGLKEPYIGRLALVTGEIADDLTAYYYISEQQNTSVALGVKLDTQSDVVAAGGMIIQMLPDPQPGVIDALEALLKDLPPISKLISDTLSESSESDNEETIMSRLMIRSFENIAEDYKVIPLNCLDTRWNCDCSEERIEQVLLSLGVKDLRQIIEEDGKAELVCHFCESKYQFDKQHLEKILAEALGKYKFGDNSNSKGNII